VGASTATTEPSKGNASAAPTTGGGVCGAADVSGGPAEPAVVAVDIGGTKVAASLVDHTGHLLTRSAAPTPDADDPEAVFAALAGVVRSAVGGSPVQPVACGVGCGGPMEDAGETVSPLNIRAWRRFPIRRRLAELLGVRVWVDNDAKALALGEQWMGAARGSSNFLAMVVSTGVGGGIVLDGRLLDGTDGNAGHIGHVVVEPDGRKCTCGGRGCLGARHRQGRASQSERGGQDGCSHRQAPVTCRIDYSLRPRVPTRGASLEL